MTVSKPTQEPQATGSANKIERAGWMAKHPLTGELVEVRTAEWFKELRAERDSLEEQLEALREALTKIASCESHIDGDVVSIAHAVLVPSPASRLSDA